jgi:hypothetical protein
VRFLLQKETGGSSCLQLYCCKKVGVQAPDVFAVETLLPILKKKLLLIHLPVWLHLAIR